MILNRNTKPVVIMPQNLYTIVFGEFDLPLGVRPSGCRVFTPSLKIENLTEEQAIGIWKGVGFKDAIELPSSVFSTEENTTTFIGGTYSGWRIIKQA
jgi:hypothetical protein